MIPNSEFRPPSRSRFLLAGFLVLTPAVLSTVVAIGVARGRARVEANVRALVAVQRLNEGPAEGQVLQDLSRHGDPAVAQAAKGGQISAVVAALRSANAVESARLGLLINGLFVAVGFLFALGAASLALLWQLKKSASTVVTLAESQIEAARREFADRVAASQTLAAVTAHEINNPLTAVALNLEQMQSAEMTKEDLAESLAACIDGTQRIGQIVKKLQGVGGTDGEAGVDLVGVVESTLLLLAHRIGASGRVEPSLQTTGRVRADFVGLGQVLSNLVVNALEACHGRTPTAVVAVESRDDGAGWIALSVKDNGPGWNPETHAKLLQPFFTTKPTGTGLGLFVCKQIIEGFGGELTLPVTTGGAEVRVRLRRVEAATPPATRL